MAAAILENGVGSFLLVILDSVCGYQSVYKISSKSVDNWRFHSVTMVYTASAGWNGVKRSF
jgi:hypothetical protein